MRLLSIAVILASVACGHASNTVALSAIAADPAKYDGQEITVSGTVENPTSRRMRRGTATVYNLCDNACIRVLEFGDANVSDGGRETVTGHFRNKFGRRRFRMQNVLVVGSAFR